MRLSILSLSLSIIILVTASEPTNTFDSIYSRQEHAPSAFTGIRNLFMNTVDYLKIKSSAPTVIEEVRVLPEGDFVPVQRHPISNRRIHGGTGHGSTTRFRRIKKDSEAVAEGEDSAEESDLESRGEQYPFSNSTSPTTDQNEDSDSEDSDCDDSEDDSDSNTDTAIKPPSLAVNSITSEPLITNFNSNSNNGKIFQGVSSYYLFALSPYSRKQVLDEVAGAGFKVVRIFIAGVYANNKGSDSIAVNDLEPKMGQYDDTILNLIDELMFECSTRGLKLLITCADRYELGFWSTNDYATQLSIVPPGSSGAQKVTNAARFYTDKNAISSFDKRLTHILAHKNPLLDNKPWSSLDSAIYAFEPQNESQGYMDVADVNWVCERAGLLKSLITSSVQVSSGGGTELQNSLGSWATSCSSLDIISVHTYSTDPNEISSAINAAKLANPSKQIILGEFGLMGENKAEQVTNFVKVFNQAGISWMIWQIVNPGAKADNYEIWIDEPAWFALKSGLTPRSTPSVTISSNSPSATSKNLQTSTSTNYDNTPYSSASYTSSSSNSYQIAGTMIKSRTPKQSNY